MTLTPEILALSSKISALMEVGESHFFEKCLPEGIDSKVVEKLRQYESDFISAIYLSLGKQIVNENTRTNSVGYSHSYNLNIGTENDVRVMNAEFSSTEFTKDLDVIDGKVRGKYIDCRFMAIAPESTKNYLWIRDELVRYAKIKAVEDFN